MSETKNKHTPGPWFIGALESGQAAVDAASGDVTGWVSIPDAHLIAAAPDMLDALEKARITLAGLYRSGVDFDESVFQIIGDAIRKAYGVR